MSDLLAALVASQWRRMESLRQARAVRFRKYQDAFAALAADGSLRLPVIPVQCEPAYHIYFCRVDTASTRSRLITALRAAGIEASSHFVPLQVLCHHYAVLKPVRIETRTVASSAPRKVRCSTRWTYRSE